VTKKEMKISKETKQKRRHRRRRHHHHHHHRYQQQLWKKTYVNQGERYPS